jgi:hypothetical protein
MSRRRLCLGGLLLVAVAGCEQLVLAPQPGLDNLAIFDEYATIVREKVGVPAAEYAALMSLSDSLREQVTPGLSERELLDKLSVLTFRMKEGHTTLSAVIDGENVLVQEWHFAGYPPASNALFLFQLTHDSVTKVIGEGAVPISYRTLPGAPDIGYVQIPWWEVRVSDAEYDTMFADLANTRGLVIDLRNNIGGYLSSAVQLARRFATEEMLVGTHRAKVGPGPDDFVPSPISLRPAATGTKWSKPVVVLTSRVTFSAASDFSYLTEPLPDVTTMGQTVGGGTGNIVDGYLANGWKWVLSTSYVLDQQGRNLNKGWEPEVPVAFEESTVRDNVIEAAVAYLRGG